MCSAPVFTVEGHDSSEDAAACMELMFWKIKEDAKVKRWPLTALLLSSTPPGRLRGGQRFWSCSERDGGTTEGRHWWTSSADFKTPPQRRAYCCCCLLDWTRELPVPSKAIGAQFNSVVFFCFFFLILLISLSVRRKVRLYFCFLLFESLKASNNSWTDAFFFFFL